MPDDNKHVGSTVDLLDNQEVTDELGKILVPGLQDFFKCHPDDPVTLAYATVMAMTYLSHYVSEPKFDLRIDENGIFVLNAFDGLTQGALLEVVTIKLPVFKVL